MASDLTYFYIVHLLQYQLNSKMLTVKLKENSFFDEADKGWLLADKGGHCLKNTGMSKGSQNAQMGKCSKKKIF